MAGVKGRSGGARPGAGRKKVPSIVVSTVVAQIRPGEPMDPRPTLEQVALGRLEVSPQQLKALTALLPYVHAKKSESGKRDDAADKLKAASKGKFGVRQGPRLVASK